ncbi:unnamed protein product [Euphydryas editha]|uniref:Uncharacterized protein n=1 Tax=Euphydryas editha TaxID=104508 RepID=A0AAU9U6K9_EUPED|nr:unnamed protein product [Euphydryas editha]
MSRLTFPHHRKTIRLSLSHTGCERGANIRACKYRAALARAPINDNIWKSLRHDICVFNSSRIKDTTDRNQGFKVFSKDLSGGQSRLLKLKTEDSKEVQHRLEPRY